MSAGSRQCDALESAMFVTLSQVTSESGFGAAASIGLPRARTGSSQSTTFVPALPAIAASLPASCGVCAG